jgi:predicted lipid-binding transport protein (Tim44 family)
MRTIASMAASVLLLAVLGLAPAMARPGGGQNYRAPSRSSSSSSSTHSAPVYHSSSPSSPSSSSTSYGTSSSGGGGGGSAGLVVLIVVVLVFLLLIWLSRRSSRATVAVDARAQHAGLAALREHDPGFDAAKFATRVTGVMQKINDAWVQGNMSPARRLVSDGVFVRFQTQLALLKADGLRNALADWKPISADVLAAEADPLWDTVHVKIAAEGRDSDVPASLSDADALKKARSASLQRYQEVWSFVRRRGQKSKDGLPMLEGKCPGCGAPMPVSDSVRCEFCKAVVNSGEHDWVLAEITQPEEWSAGTVAEEPQGLAELRRRDATVSRQELEDRASVIFWKWIEARITGQRKKLDRFCLEVGEPEIERAALKQVAVGSAVVDEISCDAQVDGRDRVDVVITWSASVAGAAPAGCAHRFGLARSAKALSKRGLSSLDCPNCGGALVESDDIKCRYCGEKLTGGKHEWSLESVEEEEV